MQKFYQKFTIILAALSLSAIPKPAFSQALTSAAMRAWPKGIMVPFAWSDAGQDFSSVQWGIDTAWQWDWWHLRTVNFMKDYATIGRITIDPRTSGSYTELSDDQKSRIDTELTWLSGATQLKNLFILGGISGQWGSSNASTFANDLVMAANYVIGKGYKVVAITPFNEPDYQGPWGYGPLNSVASILKNNSTVTSNGIYIAGPSCLNNDNSNSWWGGISSNFTMGNTHQLGGGANSFINFYTQVSNAGKPSSGDEMHTTNDAIMGMQYGLDYGIWWSDHNASGYAQAELGRAAKGGNRIAYAEDRNAFASAAIFKINGDDDLGEAFAGSSERQGSATAFSYVSQDRLVYYDGYGPLYDYTAPINGGYSEAVTELAYGEDVPETTLNGVFKLVNKATGRLLTNTSSGLAQADDANSSQQRWLISQLPSTNGGDRSYATVTLYTTSSYLDAQNQGAANGSTVQLYAGGGNNNELWHFRYMGDGYYMLTNHHDGLCLEGSSDGTSSTPTAVSMWERTGSDRQLWKLIPYDGSTSAAVPAAPANLSAKPATGSIALTWDDVSNAYSYNVYRYNNSVGIWETIGRDIMMTKFTDNAIDKHSTYRYRVRALNSAWVKGEPSAEVSAKAAQENGVIGQWPLNEGVGDRSGNLLQGARTGVTFDQIGDHDSAAVMQGSGYIALPYHVADMHSLTFTAWVYPTSDTDWQRIFDFGRNTSEYLFLTPDNGQAMRFEICHGGTKQGVNGTQKLPLNTWSHVAVTIGDDGVRLYLNGAPEASSTDITFRPDDIRPTLSYIGRSMFDADPLYSGAINEVAIYNYALSDDEIAAAYTSQFRHVLDNASKLADKPMNKDVLQTYLTAADNVKAALEGGSVSTEAMAAYNTAQAAVQTSVTAYEKAQKALEAELAVLTDNTFYSAEARQAYGYDANKQKYDDRTLTDNEANAIENPSDHSIGYKVDNATNTLLLQAWGGKNGYDANNLYINTWSTESDGRNSAFQAPFFECWTGDANSLTAQTLTATMEGLEPGRYTVSLTARCRMKDDGGQKPQGVTMTATGYTTSRNLCVGTAYTADNGTWTQGQASTLAKVGDDGVLKLNIIIASDNNVSWLSFKDVKYRLLVPSGIKTARADKADDGDDAAYSLSGQRVGSSYKGIVIKKGKKFIRR